MKDIRTQGTDVSLVCNTSTDLPSTHVPLKFHYPVFEKLHSLLHPGVQATRVITSHYVCRKCITKHPSLCCKMTSVSCSNTTSLNNHFILQLELLELIIAEGIEINSVMRLLNY